MLVKNKSVIAEIGAGPISHTIAGRAGAGKYNLVIKLFFTLIAMFLVAQLFAQSNEETSVLRLSKQIFTWEVDNQIDSLENIFDEKFTVVSSNGESQSKQQYIARLRSGNFTHNSINVEENTAIVADNTAVAVGKGKFTVTVSGNIQSLHLSYTEVLTRSGTQKAWKVLAMHASLLEH
jgi:hypothetical protein